MKIDLHISILLLTFAIEIVGGRVPMKGGFSTSPFSIRKVELIKKVDNMPKKLTQSDFIARAISVHGYKYDYSKTVYVYSTQKVTITCPIHGDFQITPDRHIGRKQGCPKCKGRNKTTKEFIQEAQKVHGNKYDYSKTVYRGSGKKVIITCPIHGDFEMSPLVHVNRKCGCKYCSGKAKVTQEMFINRAIQKYGNKYDYSLVEYKGRYELVTIKCNTCGTIFSQNPRNHICGLQGGCPTCRYKHTAKSETTPFEDFIRKAKETHGNLYEYHKNKYSGMKYKTLITCPKHGDFWQLAISHINGCGCPICGNESAKEKLTFNKEVFLQKVRAIHGDRYDYSLVDYVDYCTKVKIICPKHGIFEQTPSNHWKGRGCPHCKKSAGENKIRAFLKNQKVDFLEQFRFTNENIFCENKYIFVDFYLPQNNVVIEFNGMQHYKPIETWGGEKAFEKQQIRDDAVATYCHKHKIKLIVIAYNEESKIKEILTKKLKLKKKRK